MSGTHRLLDRYGPSALVTGASSGIGREIAVQLAEAGLDLVLVARREDVLRELADRLMQKHGVVVHVVPLDLAHPDAPHELAVRTVGIDIGLYVAAAGFGTSGPFLAATTDHERDLLRVNCEAVLTTSLVLGRRMAERGRGGLVLMGSVVGFQGTPHAAHYAATKAYVQALGEALHVELRPHGVDVVVSAPGPTHSGFAARADMAMSRALTPEVVARGTLAALGRRSTAYPGLLTKVLTGSLALLPRRARVRVMGKVMSGMTRHQGAADEHRDH